MKVKKMKRKEKKRRRKRRMMMMMMMGRRELRGSLPFFSSFQLLGSIAKTAVGRNRRVAVH